MTTTCTQHDWTTPDGESFSYSRWDADITPRAVLVAVHGLSGAALDYEPLGRPLAARGIITLAPELRGQGNDPSPARRGDLAALDEWFADLAAFLARARRENPGLPLFCYGESMGAALLVRLLARDGNREKISGLVLASPVVALPRRPRGWEDAVFRFLLTFWPRHRVDVRKFTRAKKNAPVRFVTRDEEHRRWFETAAHKLDRFTFRFFRCLLDLVDGCGAAASRLQLPVLVLYAAHDLFIQPAQIEAFFDRLGSAEKERAFFPEAYHLLLHDHDRDLVLARIEAWLGARLDEIHEGNQPGLASGRASR